MIRAEAVWLSNRGNAQITIDRMDIMKVPLSCIGWPLLLLPSLKKAVSIVAKFQISELRSLDTSAGTYRALL
jgi:hypothetical protein